MNVPIMLCRLLQDSQTRLQTTTHRQPSACCFPVPLHPFLAIVAVSRVCFGSLIAHDPLASRLSPKTAVRRSPWKVETDRRDR